MVYLMVAHSVEHSVVWTEQHWEQNLAGETEQQKVAPSVAQWASM